MKKTASIPKVRVQTVVHLVTGKLRSERVLIIPAKQG